MGLEKGFAFGVEETEEHRKERRETRGQGNEPKQNSIEKKRVEKKGKVRDLRLGGKLEESSESVLFVGPTKEGDS